MLYMLFCGILWGILYDGIRISRVLTRLAVYTHAGNRLAHLGLPLIGAPKERKKTPHSRRLAGVMMAIGDVFFFAAAACIFSVLLVHAASGVFRWFYLLAALLGFAAYYFTLGRAVMLSSEIIAAVVRTVFRYLFWLFCLPFRLLGKLSRWLRRKIQHAVLLPLRNAALLRERKRYTERIQKELPTAIRLSYERSD